MARPSTYNFEIASEICDQVANGEHIFDILEKDDRYPTWPTFRKWKTEHEELLTMYVNSQRDKAEACTHKIKTIQDKLENGQIEAAAANVIIQTNKWFSSKFYPKMYGDKVDLTTDGEKIEAPQIVIRKGGED